MRPAAPGAENCRRSLPASALNNCRTPRVLSWKGYSTRTVHTIIATRQKNFADNVLLARFSDVILFALANHKVFRSSSEDQPPTAAMTTRRLLRRATPTMGVLAELLVPKRSLGALAGLLNSRPHEPGITIDTNQSDGLR
jgi:hypothetical protein